MSKDFRGTNFRYSMEIEGRAKQILMEKGFIILAEPTYARSSEPYDVIVEKDGIKYAVNVKGTRTGGYGMTAKNIKGLQEIADCKAAFLFMEGNKLIGFFVLNELKGKRP